MHGLIDLLLQGRDPSEFVFGLGALLIILGLIALAVVVLSIVVTIQAYQAGRSGWWLYLIAIFVSPLNLVAVVAWFAYLKKNPLRVDGRPFL